VKGKERRGVEGGFGLSAATSGGDGSVVPVLVYCLFRKHRDKRSCGIALIHMFRE
jgi:hypothetical protein